MPQLTKLAGPLVPSFSFTKFEPNKLPTPQNMAPKLPTPQDVIPQPAQPLPAPNPAADVAGMAKGNPTPQVPAAAARPPVPPIQNQQLAQAKPRPVAYQGDVQAAQRSIPQSLTNVDNANKLKDLVKSRSQLAQTVPPASYDQTDPFESKAVIYGLNAGNPGSGGDSYHSKIKSFDSAISRAKQQVRPDQHNPLIPVINESGEQDYLPLDPRWNASGVNYPKPLEEGFARWFDDQKAIGGIRNLTPSDSNLLPDGSKAVDTPTELGGVHPDGLPSDNAGRTQDTISPSTGYLNHLSKTLGHRVNPENHSLQPDVESEVGLATLPLSPALSGFRAGAPSSVASLAKGGPVARDAWSQSILKPVTAVAEQGTAAAPAASKGTSQVAHALQEAPIPLKLAPEAPKGLPGTPTLSGTASTGESVASQAASSVPKSSLPGTSLTDVPLIGRGLEQMGLGGKGLGYAINSFTPIGAARVLADSARMIGQGQPLNALGNMVGKNFMLGMGPALTALGASKLDPDTFAANNPNYSDSKNSPLPFKSLLSAPFEPTKDLVNSSIKAVTGDFEGALAPYKFNLDNLKTIDKGLTEKLPAVRDSIARGYEHEQNQQLGGGRELDNFNNQYTDDYAGLVDKQRNLSNLRNELDNVMASGDSARAQEINKNLIAVQDDVNDSTDKMRAIARQAERTRMFSGIDETASNEIEHARQIATAALERQGIAPTDSNVDSVLTRMDNKGLALPQTNTQLQDGKLVTKPVIKTDKGNEQFRDPVVRGGLDVEKSKNIFDTKMQDPAFKAKFDGEVNAFIQQSKEAGILEQKLPGISKNVAQVGGVLGAAAASMGGIGNLIKDVADPSSQSAQTGQQNLIEQLSQAPREVPEAAQPEQLGVAPREVASPDAAQRANSIWSNLGIGGKALIIGGLSLAAVSLLVNVFGDDEEDGDGVGGLNFLWKLAPLLGIGAAVAGTTWSKDSPYPQLDVLGNADHWQGLYNDAKALNPF